MMKVTKNVITQQVAIALLTGLNLKASLLPISQSDLAGNVIVPLGGVVYLTGTRARILQGTLKQMGRVITIMFITT